jgi:hypothetical protein
VPSPRSTLSLVYLTTPDRRRIEGIYHCDVVSLIMPAVA